MLMRIGGDSDGVDWMPLLPPVKLLCTSDVTQILQQIEQGDPTASDSHEHVYPERLWAAPTVAGDKITFTTKKSDKMIEMPEMFSDVSGAKAYTNNVVNSVVNDSTIIMPLVAKEVNVMNDYIREAAKRAGFAAGDIHQVSDQTYHDNTGSLHCGANVFREIDDDWWK